MKRIFTALFILTLSGCTTSVCMSPENQKQIHKISVNKHVALPKKMAYYGPEEAKAQMVGGLIGAAIVNSTAKENCALIEKMLADQHVNINDVVLNDLSQKITNKHTLNIVTNNKSDAELVVTIANYGFHAQPFLSDKYTPVLNVKAELVKDNKVVWAKSASSTGNTKGLPAYSLDEIRKNPTHVKEMLVAASNMLTNEILQTL